MPSTFLWASRPSVTFTCDNALLGYKPMGERVTDSAQVRFLWASRPSVTFTCDNAGLVYKPVGELDSGKRRL